MLSCLTLCYALSLKLNFPIIIPTICTILVEFFFAIPFPMALPPTVRDATIALIINCKLKVNANFSFIFLPFSEKCGIFPCVFSAFMLYLYLIISKYI